MKKIFIIIFFTPLFVLSQQTKEVLFLGNSYTYVNDLPNMVKQIALSFGDTLNYDQNTPGGATLQMHSTNTQTLSKIPQKEWDNVVIQCQSQEPSFSPTQVSNDVYPYAQILIDSIESNSLCTEPMFFMTWGRKYGDQQNCQFYPPICTYNGMQQRLRQSYLQMSINHNASCAPVGMVWKESIEQDSTLNLYSSDNSHPSLEGSYLSACTFYASIFKNSPIGTTYIPNGMDTATSSFLQTIASNTVLDSLSIWNIFNADFTYQQTFNGVVSFTSLSSNYESLLWDFGDGQTSTDENPQNAYFNSGDYDVTLYAYTNNSCLVDSFTISINVFINLSVEEQNNNRNLINITDLLGRKTQFKKNSILLYFFDNGEVEKKIITE
ncbi:PKD domain-containing protein [Flavobacteriales bacterium]|nr:PKD domain-containing protein [Flavobacteriales bacterium]